MSVGSADPKTSGAKPSWVVGAPILPVQRIGQTLEGEFIIKNILGQGELGTTYEAENSRLRARYAVLMLSRELSPTHEMLMAVREDLRRARTLQAPGLMPVKTVADRDGIPGYATELLEGETLRARLRRSPLRVERAVAIVAMVAQTMDAAHQVGLLHGDLRPENIFLVKPSAKNTSAGRVMIVEYGLHHLRRRSAGLDEQLPLYKQIYRPPEQVAGVIGAGAAGDIFVLGAVLHECLTGKPAFFAEEIEFVLENLASPPPALQANPATGLTEDLARALTDLVRHACALTLEDRMGSMGLLATALLQLAKDQGLKLPEVLVETADEVVAAAAGQTMAQVEMRRLMERRSGVFPHIRLDQPSDVPAAALQALQASQAGAEGAERKDSKGEPGPVKLERVQQQRVTRILQKLSGAFPVLAVPMIDVGRKPVALVPSSPVLSTSLPDAQAPTHEQRAVVAQGGTPQGDGPSAQENAAAQVKPSQRTPRPANPVGADSAGTSLAIASAQTMVGTALPMQASALTPPGGVVPEVKRPDTSSEQQPRAAAPATSPAARDGLSVTALPEAKTLSGTAVPTPLTAGEETASSATPRSTEEKSRSLALDTVQGAAAPDLSQAPTKIGTAPATAPASIAAEKPAVAAEKSAVAAEKPMERRVLGRAMTLTLHPDELSELVETEPLPPPPQSAPTHESLRTEEQATPGGLLAQISHLETRPVMAALPTNLAAMPAPMLHEQATQPALRRLPLVDLPTQIKQAGLPMLEAVLAPSAVTAPKEAPVEAPRSAGPMAARGEAAAAAEAAQTHDAKADGKPGSSVPKPPPLADIMAALSGQPVPAALLLEAAVAPGPGARGQSRGRLEPVAAVPLIGDAAHIVRQATPARPLPVVAQAQPMTAPLTTPTPRRSTIGELAEKQPERFAAALGALVVLGLALLYLLLL